MSSSSFSHDIRSPGPKVLVSGRTYLTILLVSILFVLTAIWRLGVGLTDGQGLAAGLATILVFATLGEFVRKGCRMSLKGLLVAFTVLALLLGTLSQRLIEARKRGQIAQRLQRLGASVQYDYQNTGDDWLTLGNGLCVPSWARDLVGDEVFAHATSISLLNSRCRDADLAGVGELRSLSELRLSGSAVTDRGIAALAGLPNLDTVTLNGIQATEAGLKALGESPRLVSLQLYGPHVTDATLRHLRYVAGLRGLLLYDTNVTNDGLRHLAPLQELETLSIDSRQFGESGIVHLHSLPSLRNLLLERTVISDAGLKELAALRRLEYLSLSRSAVSKDAIDKLRAALPETEISD